MKRIVLLYIFILITQFSYAQTQPGIVAKDNRTEEPLIGATVSLKGEERSFNGGIKIKF
jgi:hypothetical protein